MGPRALMRSPTPKSTLRAGFIRRFGPDGRDSMGPGWVPELNKRTFPFVMAPINTRIVRRSNALMGDAYGAQGLGRRTLNCFHCGTAPRNAVLQ